MAKMVYGKITVIKRNGDNGSQYPVTSSSCTFGRDADCEIRIQLPTVSNQECKLESDENGNFVLSKHSKGGVVKVNDEIVDSSAVINHKDVLTIAGRFFRFEYPPKFIGNRRSSIQETKNGGTPKSLPQNGGTPRPSRKSVGTPKAKRKSSGSSVLKHIQHDNLMSFETPPKQSVSAKTPQPERKASSEAKPKRRSAGTKFWNLSVTQLNRKISATPKRGGKSSQDAIKESLKQATPARAAYDDATADSSVQNSSAMVQTDDRPTEKSGGTIEENKRPEEPSMEEMAIEEDAAEAENAGIFSPAPKVYSAKRKSIQATKRNSSVGARAENAGTSLFEDEAAENTGNEIIESNEADFAKPTPKSKTPKSRRRSSIAPPSDKGADKKKSVRTPRRSGAVAPIYFFGEKLDDTLPTLQLEEESSGIEEDVASSDSDQNPPRQQGFSSFVGQNVADDMNDTVPVDREPNLEVEEESRGSTSVTGSDQIFEAETSSDNADYLDKNENIDVPTPKSHTPKPRRSSIKGATQFSTPAAYVELDDTVPIDQVSAAHTPVHDISTPGPASQEDTIPIEEYAQMEQESEEIEDESFSSNTSETGRESIQMATHGISTPEAESQEDTIPIEDHAQMLEDKSTRTPTNRRRSSGPKTPAQNAPKTPYLPTPIRDLGAALEIESNPATPANLSLFIYETDDEAAAVDRSDLVEYSGTPQQIRRQSMRKSHNYAVTTTPRGIITTESDMGTLSAGEQNQTVEVVSVDTPEPNRRRGGRKSSNSSTATPGGLKTPVSRSGTPSASQQDLEVESVGATNRRRSGRKSSNSGTTTPGEMATPVSRAGTPAGKAFTPKLTPGRSPAHVTPNMIRKTQTSARRVPESKSDTPKSISVEPGTPLSAYEDIFATPDIDLGPGNSTPGGAVNPSSATPRSTKTKTADISTPGGALTPSSVTPSRSAKAKPVDASTPGGAVAPSSDTPTLPKDGKRADTPRPLSASRPQTERKGQPRSFIRSNQRPMSERRPTRGVKITPTGTPKMPAPVMTPRSNIKGPQAQSKLLQRVKAQSRRVSFGPQLSPEQFVSSLPPNTPVKKGAVPIQPLDDTAEPSSKVQKSAARGRKKTPAKRRSLRRSTGRKSGVLLWSEIVRKNVDKQPEERAAKQGKIPAPKRRKMVQKTPEQRRAYRHVDSPATIYIGRAQRRGRRSSRPMPPLELSTDESFNDSYSYSEADSSVSDTHAFESQEKMDAGNAKPTQEAAESSGTDDPLDIGRLYKTPKDKKRGEPVEEHYGTKRLLKTPKEKTENAEVEDHFGTKRLMKTPRPEKGVEVAENFGTKRLLKTPTARVVVEPVQEHFGTKRLLTTPKEKEHPDPVEDHFGTKRLLTTPKVAEKGEEVTEHFGTKRLLQTPKDRTSYTPVEDHLGLKRLMQAPRGEKSTPVTENFGMGRLMKTPEEREKSEKLNEMISECIANPPPDTRIVYFSESGGYGLSHLTHLFPGEPFEEIGPPHDDTIEPEQEPFEEQGPAVEINVAQPANEEASREIGKGVKRKRGDGTGKNVMQPVEIENTSPPETSSEHDVADPTPARRTTRGRRGAARPPVVDASVPVNESLTRRKKAQSATAAADEVVTKASVHLAPPARRATRGRRGAAEPPTETATGKKAQSSIIDADNSSTDSHDGSPVKMPKPTRGRGKAEEKDTLVTGDAEGSEAPKRGGRRAKAGVATTTPKPEASEAKIESVAPKRATRGKKVAFVEPVPVTEEPAAQIETAAPKRATRGRKVACVEQIPATNEPADKIKEAPKRATRGRKAADKAPSLAAVEPQAEITAAAPNRSTRGKRGAKEEAVSSTDKPVSKIETATPKRATRGKKGAKKEVSASDEPVLEIETPERPVRGERAKKEVLASDEPVVEIEAPERPVRGKRVAKVAAVEPEEQAAEAPRKTTRAKRGAAAKSLPEPRSQKEAPKSEAEPAKAGRTSRSKRQDSSQSKEDKVTEAPSKRSTRTRKAPESTQASSSRPARSKALPAKLLETTTDTEANVTTPAKKGRGRNTQEAVEPAQVERPARSRAPSVKVLESIAEETESTQSRKRKRGVKGPTLPPPPKSPKEVASKPTRSSTRGKQTTEKPSTTPPSKKPSKRGGKAPKAEKVAKEETAEKASEAQRETRKRKRSEEEVKKGAKSANAKKDAKSAKTVKVEEPPQPVRKSSRTRRK